LSALGVALPRLQLPTQCNGFGDGGPPSSPLYPKWYKARRSLTRLHWVAILYGRMRADLAVTRGVHAAYDVMKAWMEEHEYESVQQMQGSMSQRKVAHPNAFLRANYLKVLSSYAMRA
jgi:hypothetical protein